MSWALFFYIHKNESTLLKHFDYTITLMVGWSKKKSLPHCIIDITIYSQLAYPNDVGWVLCELSS